MRGGASTGVSFDASKHLGSESSFKRRASNETDVEAPKAVTGWLLVLCLILTFEAPAVNLYDFGRHAIPVLISTHRIARFLLLDMYSIMCIATAGLSFIAGTKLWLLKASAVRFAKRFLLTYTGLHVAYFVLWIIVDRPAKSLSIARMGSDHVGGPFLFLALWYSYLKRSDRVRATYPSG